MRILWVSAGMGASGYGVQTRIFLRLLRAAGHDVTLFALTHIEGGEAREVDGFKILPRGLDPAGSDVIRGHSDRSGADLVVTLADPHVFDPRAYGEVPWCAYAPVDCTPLAAETRHSLLGARWIWAPSRHAEKQILEAGFDNVTYVPHLVEGEVFHPADRGESRATLMRARAFGEEQRHVEQLLDDKFLVVMVAANNSRPSRKGFYEAFSAFARFAKDHPEALLYVHSEIAGREHPGGEDLLAVATLAGLDPEKILFAPQYPLVCGDIDQVYLRAVYNTADVFLSASHGEGFGIPSLEAQACGCPVILPKNSAQAELCLTGWPVECDTYSPYPGITWARPRVEALAAALEKAWQSRGDEPLRKMARERALAYDADATFAQYAVPALDQIARDIADKRDRRSPMTAKILPASEALRLPSAKLTDEEEKTVEKLVTEINGGIEAGNMKLNGFSFTTNCANPAVVFELVLRLQEAGYDVSPQPILKPPRVQGAGPTHEGYSLTVTPKREAVEAARRPIQ